ncbi:uncharacterized protein DSM5745_08782 [Aspergillus mulundensis]|uniref:Autophagy protein n=1 Tax=Aspergillus mulundensis TaxID=1810919 RepID=A0A3D8R4N2_9EURO|nr:Uncharacterized protein DSM5745_08782 [Aspergillus mulundensis]RDW69022.1 Uncharacterized protein DSM5745_08782 [Aspergillus mulundensis]
MGWFWGSDNEDPVKKLDPGLREYLENEAPKKYVPATQSSPVAEEHALPSKPASSDNDASATAPAVPTASLFPDGRYADLWKTYKPPSPGDIETETSEVSSMQAQSKQRHAMVKRAAMENCSIENEIYHLCLKSPTLIERVTACQDKSKVFTRCYATQSKFLQALGYASTSHWDDEREERIQLHADKLYHEMLNYEKQVEEAREAGQEPPPLKSLFNPQAEPVQRASVGPAELEIPGGEPIPEGFKPSKSLERLTPHERELEVRAYYQELEEQRAYVKSMAPVIRAHEEGRDKRREKLVSWFGETVGTWLTR